MLCVSVSEIMYRGTVVMVIWVLLLVISITEFREPSAFEDQKVIWKLKRHKSPGVDQIPAELFKARGRTILSESLNLLSLFETRRNRLRIGRSRSLHLHIRRVIKNCNNYRAYQFVNYVQIFIYHSALKLTPYAEEIILGHQFGFGRNSSTTDHIFCICQIPEKNWEYN